MSSGSVTEVTGTLFKMRNTLCWTVRMNIRPQHGHKLKLLVWNVHGIGGHSADANAELKITDVCSMIKLHDIAVLTETRASDASRLLQHLPGFTVHNIQLDRGNKGKNGHGIAVLVAPSCSDLCVC